MHWIDWIIVLIPIAIVGWIGFKTQKYVKGVADFLTAGRVAGRYVVCVAGAEASMGLITIVAMFEAYYNSGFAYGFWNGITAPISLIMLLTGYCFYRYRQTRAMTLGQFLEIRYSRSFRIFAAVLQSISGIVNYGLFPAVGARFLVYFCGLPLNVELFGWVFPTFALVMATFLFIAVFVATMGGQITIMVTDCVQGILSYPLYAIIVGYIIYRFSWFHDIAPTMLYRPPGKSLLNPFDIAKLRDFNIFFVLVGIFFNIVNRMSWSGTQGYNAAAKNAHEQKMGAVLGAWRSGFSMMMYVLLAAVAIMFFNSASLKDGAQGADACRNALAAKAFDDIAKGEKYDDVRREYKEFLQSGTLSPELRERIDEATAGQPGDITATDGGKEPVFTVGKLALRSVSPEKSTVFATIFGQMQVPMALKYIMPVGITGIFCALCIFLLISTDTTYLHSWGSIVVQDLILPIRGRSFTPGQQLALLRILIIGVAIFAFFFSYFFGQIDYILMFFSITGAIWFGGAGACIVGGLYWKRGTTAGAWAALISGSVLATGGIIVQKMWAGSVYPWLCQNGMLERFTSLIEGISAPFEPYILWRVTPEKFPINSKEILFIAMVVGIVLYVLVSLLTCRKHFNMDRMLHRGKYQREGKIIEKKPLTVRTALLKILGINEEYTRGDKVIAWSVFLYAFGWGFLISFVLIAVWHKISPWSDQAWVNWFFIKNILVASAIAVVSTVWFTIGGTVDLRRMFISLKEKQTNVLDDGRVIDHVSADDLEVVDTIEYVEDEKA